VIFSRVVKVLISSSSSILTNRDVIQLKGMFGYIKFFVCLGEQACDAIVHVDPSSFAILSTLIDLLTIEARSFSAQIIKTIKIVEISSGPMLLPSYPQPVKAPQPVVLIPANQPVQQQYQTYALENSEMNRTTPKYIIQQHSKPLLIGDILPSGNILTVTTTPANIASNINEKKRKLDGDIISTIINDTSKRSRLCPVPTKNPVNIQSTSMDDETNPSSTVHSTMNDLLDRCSSVDSDVRLCLDDLCQRVAVIVDQSLSDIFNQLPSPVFKRKTTTQLVKEGNHLDEQSQQMKYDSSSRNQPIVVNTSNTVTPTEKKDERSVDMKPMATHDYVCEWDNCRA
jgi:hypothetical protein